MRSVIRMLSGTLGGFLICGLLFWGVDIALTHYLAAYLSFDTHLLIALTVTGLVGLTLALIFPDDMGKFRRGFAWGGLLVFLLCLGFGGYVLYTIATGKADIDMTRNLARWAVLGLIIALIGAFTKSKTVPARPGEQKTQATVTGKPAKRAKPKSKAWAFIKSLTGSVLIAVIVLSPAIVLLFLNYRIAGIAALFLGSFYLTYRSYRKPWVVTFLSAAIPILTALGCYGLQLVLFKDRLPEPLYAFGAAFSGALIGWLRARSHKLHIEDGKVMAQRTAGYLFIWMLAFAATQGLSLYSRDVLYLHAGLLTGAFSTALVVITTLVIFARKGSVQAAAILCVGVLILPIGPPAYAQLDTSRVPFPAGECVSQIGQSPGPGLTCICYPRLGLMAEQCAWERMGAPQASQPEQPVTPNGALCFASQEGNLIEVGSPGPGMVCDYVATPAQICAKLAGGGSGLISVASPGGIQSVYEISFPASRCQSASPAPPPTQQAQSPAIEQPTTMQMPQASDVDRWVEDLEAIAKSPEVILERIKATVGDIDLTTPEGATIAAAAALSAAGIAASLVQALSMAMGQAVAAGTQNLGEALAEAGQQASTQIDKSMPRFTDPVDGAEIAAEDGMYWAAWEGADGTWLNQADMQDYVARQQKAQKEYEENQRGWADFERKNKAWADSNRTRQQERLAQERQAEKSEKQARDYLKRLQDSAARTGKDKIHTRLTSEAMYNGDGTVNRASLQQMDRIYRQRISDDTAYADVQGNPESQGLDNALLESASALDQSIRPLKDSFLGRAGLGVVTLGTSEIVFQGHTLGEVLWDAEMKAAREGRQTTLAERLLNGGQVILEENLPVNTVKTIAQIAGGDRVSLAEFGLSVLADAGAAFDVKDGLQQGISWRGPAETIADLKKTFPIGTGALDEMVRGKAPDVPPGRISAEDARGYFDEGRVSDHTQSHIDALRKDVAGGKNVRLKEAADAYHHGRTAGQVKVDAFIEATDALETARLAGADPAEIKKLERTFRDQVLRVQGDKHAMNQMNQLPRDKFGGKESRYIQRFNQDINDIYDAADADLIKKAAARFDVDPSDIEIVKVTNEAGDASRAVSPKAPEIEHYGRASQSRTQAVLGRQHTDGLTASVQATDAARIPGDAPRVKGTKVSFDRDMTMRVKRFDENGFMYWEDVKAAETGRMYNPSFYEAATGRTGAQSHSGSFADIHLTKDQHLGDPLDIPPGDADAFAKQMDQATTDRLDAEAYGRGQADLDAATKDSLRGRDLTDAEAVANTIKYKVHHWANEADDLTKYADAARREAMELGANSPAGQAKLREAASLRAAAEGAREEAARQLTKQYNNMGIKRADAMAALGNAPGISIGADLAEDISILRRVELDPTFSIAEAEAVLKQRGTSIKNVADRLSGFVESQQVLRPKESLSLGRNPFAGSAMGSVRGVQVTPGEPGSQSSGDIRR